jgi:hypothetical protein
MKAIGRRLCKLEGQCGTAIESEFSRHLCELLERRERRAGLPPLAEHPTGEVRQGRRTIIEVLNAGRQRAEVNR